MTESKTKRVLLICRGTGCTSSNAPGIHEKLDSLIDQNGLADSVQVKLTGCHGFCQVGPILVIQPDNVMYVRLTPEDVEEIVEKHLMKNQIIERLLYEDPKSGELIQKILIRMVMVF